MEQKRIAAIVGSLRENSYNRQLALAAKEIVGDRAIFEIVDYDDVPMMNQDIEYPAPDAVCRVREQIKSADGVWIFTPEYNHSVPGSLKNALDWASKPFLRKAAAAVSFGSIGNARAVEHLRMILVEQQTVNVRQAIHIGGADFAGIMFGQTTWEAVLPNYERFVPELLENLLWWTEATMAKREADARQAA